MLEFESCWLFLQSCLWLCGCYLEGAVMRRQYSLFLLVSKYAVKSLEEEKGKEREGKVTPPRQQEAGTAIQGRSYVARVPLHAE